MQIPCHEQANRMVSVPSSNRARYSGELPRAGSVGQSLRGPRGKRDFMSKLRLKK
jgi:hypothetical protein